MREKLSLKPKILNLNDTNEIYMTLNIGILSNDVNYNKAQFLDDFIEGVIANKDIYIGIPLVVNRDKLENAEYDNLSHELVNGELKTDQIGSFIDFWTEEIDGANCLMGSIKVFKRFLKTCNAIIELYENGDLETSCEVLIDSYQEVTEVGIRKIGYNDGKNALIGSAIVSEPAEKRATATLLVAEAYKEDINDEGGLSVSEQIFNKGKDIKYHGKFEVASLKFNEVSNQIYNLLNPVDAKNGGREYNYWIRDLYTDYAIVEEWEDYETLWKIPYTIENDVVVLAAKEQWQKGKLGFIPEGIEVASLIIDSEQAVKNLQLEINNLKEEITQMAEKEKLTAEELEGKVTELNSKIEELNVLLVSEKEAKTELEGKITELNSAVEELKPFKEQVEKAEKDAKITELSEKYSKLLSEDTFKSEAVQNAIQELNSVELNSIVVNEIAKEKVVETASKGKNDDILVVASKQEDLLDKDARTYWSEKA